ncbi:MAG: Npt1/Npt2 family nucleotide transporter, partial [Myxococcota bacterium]
MATNDGHEQRRPTLVFDSLLESAFRIRPGEFRVVALMFVYLLLVVSTFIIGRTVRDTLFLHRVALDRLPLMYISVAAAVALASWLYSFIADHYRRDRLLIVTLAGFSAITAGFWLAIQTRPGAWIYFALYICVEILGAISIMQFWTFANDLFNGRQAKRLFGLIGAGGVIANIVCGFSIGLIAPVLGTEALLMMIAGLFAACVAIVHLVAGPARSALEQSVHKPRRSSLKLGLVTDRVLHSKHLQIIAGIVVVTFATVTLVDFQFKVLVRTHYQTEAELAAYFGYFYAFTGIIASLMQFLITGRLLERFGIVVALAILPIALSAGAFGILLLPALFAGTLAKGAENIFRYTINDATTQLLYVPIPSHHRGRAKAFIDGIVKQSSIALSGLLLLVTGHLFAAEQLAVSLTYVDLTLLVIWLVLIFGIRKEYIKSLIDTLQSQRLDPTETWSPIVDEQTARLLQKRLRSKDEDEVWTTLEILQALPADFQRELLALLDHSSERIRIRALALIGHSGRLDGAHHIHRLCRDDSADVRSAAITAFCAVGNERAVHAVRPFLIDAESRVRAATVTAMIRHGGLDGILTAAETLKTFLNSEQAQERLHGAHILRDIKVKNFFQPVLTLLQDHDVQVRIAAVEAAGQMRSPELVPALIYRLADAPTAMTAVRALVAYGPSIEPTLFKVLQNPKEDL